MYEQVLQEYETYIRSRQLIKDGQIEHYASWVQSFLAFAAKEGIRNFATCLLRFLRELEYRAVDWQVGQARNAIHIYYYQFRKKGQEDTCEPLDAIVPADFPQVREKALARIIHAA